MALVNQILKFLDTVRIVLLYHLWGFKGMLHDVLNKKNNRVQLTDRSGSTAVVTGGARGIGSQVVKLLMQCNFHVIIGCRDVKIGEKLITEIRNKGITEGQATVLQVDLSSLKSVKHFAEEILKNHKSINVLVNNAGVMFAPFEVTVDGFESTFAINYLGHFLLSHLLLPALNNASSTSNCNPRIINVSSIAHELSPQINFNDLDMKKYFITQSAYSQSKLCQIMSTKALDRHLRESGSTIQVIAVHPGIVNTDIFEGTFVKLTVPWLLNIFCKNPAEGGITVVYTCIAEELENKGGSYYSNCRPAKYIKYIDDVAAQEKLYEVSMDAIKPFLSN